MPFTRAPNCATGPLSCAATIAERGNCTGPAVLRQIGDSGTLACDPMTAPSPRPGRNEPCHCGSGRKYKHCCLDKDEAAAREARAKAEKAAAAASEAEPPAA